MAHSVIEKSNKYQGLVAWLAAWLAAWIVALVIVRITLPQGMFSAFSAVHLVALMLFFSVLSPLMAPCAQRGRRLFGYVLATGIAFAALAYLTGSAPFALQVGIGALTLTLFAQALLGWLNDHCGLAEASAKLAYLLAFSLACLAPLYLSPIAESWAHDLVVANLIVAMSPLSYLSSLLEFDYLRAPWFYQRIAFGALRFEYPAVGAATLCYLLASGLLLITRWPVPVLPLHHSQEEPGS